MAHYHTNYTSLLVNDDETEDSPHTDEIFQVPPEKSRWNHIEDLDSFFKRNYRFHQQGGFISILTNDIYVICQFTLIISLAIYSCHCIDYGEISRHRAQNGTHTQLELSDVLMPLSQCSANFGLITWLFISASTLMLIYYICRSIHRFFCFYETKCFYETALKIPSKDLQNTEWHEVQCKLREVQREQLMCIHKQELSELDIYHRILREENYMNAMMNKNIIVVKLKYPFLGESIHFTPLLRFNIELLLFKSPYSPFKSTWQLKEEYKKQSNRNALAAELAKGFVVLGIVNFLSCCFIFIYQLFTCVSTYAKYVQNDPKIFSSRRWSPYAMLYLRLFNELDHEFQARLNRAYDPASNYMNSFHSHLINIHAKNIAGVCGVFMLFMVAWGIWQPEIFEIPHVLPIMTCVGFICGISTRMLPNENSVYIPEQLMMNVFAHLTYLPDSWKGKAHTTNVRNEFSQFFQMKTTGIVEHIFSAILVPYVLIFHLRHRALDIVDFFRSFTVEVSGVGDVCSFALMDVSKHGNHEWARNRVATNIDQTHEAEGGKTEMSLLHFRVLNPAWQPPPSSTAFIGDFREHVETITREDASQINTCAESLRALDTNGAEHPGVLDGARYSLHALNQNSFSMDRPNNILTNIARGYINHTEGPLMSINSRLLPSMSLSTNINTPLQSVDPLRRTVEELSVTSLHLHEYHRRHVMAQRYSQFSSSQAQPSHSRNQNEEGATECKPLLESYKSV